MIDDENEDTEEPPIEVGTAYYGASGRAARHCVFLSTRFDLDSGYRVGDGETWIGINDYTVDFQGHTRVSSGTMASYTGIWSTLAGSTYVTRHDGWLLRNPDVRHADAQTRWQDTRIEGFGLDGVFGIDDRAVFVWAHPLQAASASESTVLRWDGDAWSPIPSPGMSVTAMHGTAPDDLWVAGPLGRVARWDGADWTHLPGVGTESINSLFVAHPDEVYATTVRGTVLEGTRAGLSALGTIEGVAIPGDVACVAKWRGHLWVGATRLGLLRRVGTTSRFESVKPRIDCVSMDARDELVMCCSSRVAGTADGEEFRSYGNDCVLNVRAPHRLGHNL